MIGENKNAQVTVQAREYDGVSLKVVDQWRRRSNTEMLPNAQLISIPNDV